MNKAQKASQTSFVDDYQAWAQHVLTSNEIRWCRSGHDYTFSTHDEAAHGLRYVDQILAGETTLNHVVFAFERTLRIVGELNEANEGSKGFIAENGGEAFRTWTMTLYRRLAHVVTSPANKARVAQWIAATEGALLQLKDKAA